MIECNRNNPTAERRDEALLNHGGSVNLNPVAVKMANARDLRVSPVGAVRRSLTVRRRVREQGCGPAVHGGGVDAVLPIFPLKSQGLLDVPNGNGALVIGFLGALAGVAVRRGHPYLAPNFSALYFSGDASPKNRQMKSRASRGEALEPPYPSRISRVAMPLVVRSSRAMTL